MKGDDMRIPAPRIPRYKHDLNNSDLMLGVVVLAIVMGSVIALAILVGIHWVSH